MKKFILLLLTVLSLATLINTNSNLKSHFVDIPLKYFKDNHHKAHYLTSYEIFKDNKIFGSGIKTFRYLCGDKKYENIKTKYANHRCATHPHNIYLEILSETGIFGMFMLTSSVVQSITHARNYQEYQERRLKSKDNTKFPYPK